jgi:hypothetical protein
MTADEQAAYTWVQLVLDGSLHFRSLKHTAIGTKMQLRHLLSIQVMYFFDLNLRLVDLYIHMYIL